MDISPTYLAEAVFPPFLIEPIGAYAIRDHHKDGAIPQSESVFTIS